MLELRPNCECCDRDLAAGRDQRGDLHLRVHLLQRLRARRSRWRLPQLRRQFFRTANPACGHAFEISGLDQTRAESRRLRTEVAGLTVCNER